MHEIAGAKDTLATKRDVDLLRGEIAKLGGELHAEIHRAVSVVAASGYREIPGGARDAGMDEYLVKPVRLSELQQLLADTRPRA